MAQVTGNKIKGTIITVIMAMVLFSILPSIVPDLVDDIYNFSAEMGLKTTELGTAPASFFSNTLIDLQGWFWVVGALLLIMAVVTGVLALRGGGKRRGRRRY